MNNKFKAFEEGFVYGMFLGFAFLIFAFGVLMFHITKTSKTHSVEFKPTQPIQFNKIKIDTDISFNK
jgi:hypothetical protein